MVLAMRSFSSGKVVSVSGIEGGSTPARRAPPDLAASLANWIWRVKAAMPCPRLASVKVVSGTFSSAAKVSALSRKWLRFCSERM